ncbi:MAG: L-histidine N(alpha)-methyltransferase [Anaerolineales bacterium]|nr:MAG: L-histidine N(alpha)-methyltransferase [Anaerolineales bacterium]
MKLKLDEQAFERPSQIQEFVQGLRRQFLPLKFAYIGSAAFTHDQLVKSPSYRLSDIESTLIRERFYKDIVTKLDLSKKSLNIVDIGSGNGLKAVIVLDVLFSNQFFARYLGLDYSQNLLKIAKENIVSALPAFGVINTEVVDFENESFADAVLKYLPIDQYSLFVLLGHTLGNPLNRIATLTNIRNSIIDKNSSGFCVGIELFDKAKVNEMLMNYQNDAFRRAVFTPLTFVGLSPEDGLLDIGFNHSTKNVEVYFEFYKEVHIDCGALGSVEYEKGDRILLFLSHRFDLETLRQNFAETKFEIVATLLNPKANYALLFSVPV